MSGFGVETVKRVAELARLQLTDPEATKFAGQIGDVLKYVKKLNAVDTSGVEPMTNALEIGTPTRPDEVVPSPGPSTMVGAAPESVFDSYKVPQVMG